METDYISREAAINDVKNLDDTMFVCVSMDECNGMRSMKKRAVSALERVPAADVRPVKEGRWVKARGNWCTPGGDPVWECSECGKGVHVYGIEHGTYGSDIADGQWVSCPNCGAKMGGTDGRQE